MYCGRGDGSDFSVEVDQVTTNLQMLRRNFDLVLLFLPYHWIVVVEGSGKYNLQS